MDDNTSSLRTIKEWNNVKISLHDIQTLYTDFNLLLGLPPLPSQVLFLLKPSFTKCSGPVAYWTALQHAAQFYISG